MEGLPTVPVHDLEIHPRDRELIAATHGRSIWIVDIAPLQDLNDQVFADGAGLFEPKPAFQFGTPPRGGEFYAQAWFSRPSPGSVAEISYFIGEELGSELQAAFEEQRDEARRARAEARERGEQPATPPAGERPSAAQGRPGATPTASGPQVDIVITNAEGDTVNTLKGPGGTGVNKVTWSLRGAQPEAPEQSPYEKQERERIAARARAVADSLIEAGWDESMVRRATGLFTGETDMQGLMRMFTGGGRGGRDPEEFRERPAEQGSRGMGGFGQMREIAGLILPGESTGSMMQRFRRTGGPAPLMEPGTYTVTLKAGDRTFTQTLTVERVGGFLGDTSPF
jgi:hypothetical protein